MKIMRTFFNALAVVAFALFIAATGARAATYTVDTTSDNTALRACTSAPNDCSLRGAMAAAGLTSTDDTIEFAIPADDPECESAGPCRISHGDNPLTNDLAGGRLTIFNSAGAAKLWITGAGTSTVFINRGFLTIEGVTVTAGFSSSGAGGIQNTGVLEIRKSVVSSNVSVGSANSACAAGGIGNFAGQVAVVQSTVEGNSGGGICTQSGSIVVALSTVADNTSTNSGGGIYSINGYLSVESSTLSGNTAVNGEGGGIYFEVDFTGNVLEIRNSTITANHADSIFGSGGGVRARVAGGLNEDRFNFTAINTIIAGNTAPAGPDAYGTLASDSKFSLVGNGAGMVDSTPAANLNLIGTAANPIDPRLGQLAANGGPTRTHSLLADSPAIDRGYVGIAGTDQRGLSRPVDIAVVANAGDGADIGAFEVQDGPQCGTLAITPAALPSGAAGSFYSRTLAAAGGSGSGYAFAVTAGALPPGLSLDQASGVLSGTPLADGVYNFSVTVTDSAGCAATVAFNVTFDCPTITVSPSSLPDPTFGAFYSQTLSVPGSPDVYTYHLTDGSLPPGLTLDSAAGVISGTPTAAGTFSFAIQARNPAGCGGGWQYSVTVVRNCPTIAVAAAALPGGTAGTPYAGGISATGGAAPYQYQVTGGALPPGLALNPGTGAVTGVPTTAGTFGFSVTATDANGCAGSASFTIAIGAAPVVFDAPSDLKIDYVGANFVNLRWTDNSSGEAGFRIVLCANKTCSNNVEVGQAGANATTFLVTKLLANTQYVYRVAAFDAAGRQTALSNAIAVKTLRK